FASDPQKQISFLNEVVRLIKVADIIQNRSAHHRHRGVDINAGNNIKENISGSRFDVFAHPANRMSTIILDVQTISIDQANPLVAKAVNLCFQVRWLPEIIVIYERDVLTMGKLDCL